MFKILFVAEDPLEIDIIKTVLAGEYVVILCPDGGKVPSIIKTETPDLILIDLQSRSFPDVEVIAELTVLAHHPPIVIMTTNTDVTQAVRAMQLGASGCVVKPYSQEELRRELSSRIFHAFKKYGGGYENLDGALASIIGETGPIRTVRQQICLFADCEDPILLTGESGTGKDLVANAIHKLSARRQGPFVPRNCGEFPETLVESELFGTEDGAYTGARSRQGDFELSSGGSLFLDEICELSIRAQVKLLHVLETKMIRRVGGTVSKKVDARIISATNRDIEQCVREKNFRHDLYYRINTLAIELPPLRERKEDIPLLAYSFINSRDGQKKELSARAIQKLLDYHWPGNIRELKNCIKRALVLSKYSDIQAEHVRFK